MSQQRPRPRGIPFHWGQTEVELYQQLLDAGFSSQQALESVEDTIRGNKRLSDFQRLVQKPPEKGKEEWWRFGD